MLASVAASRRAAPLDRRGRRASRRAPAWSWCAAFSRCARAASPASAAPSTRRRAQVQNGCVVGVRRYRDAAEQAAISAPLQLASRRRAAAPIARRAGCTPRGSGIVGCLYASMTEPSLLHVALGTDDRRPARRKSSSAISQMRSYNSWSQIQADLDAAQKHDGEDPRPSRRVPPRAELRVGERRRRRRTIAEQKEQLSAYPSSATVAACEAKLAEVVPDRGARRRGEEAAGRRGHAPLRRAALQAHPRRVVGDAREGAGRARRRRRRGEQRARGGPDQKSRCRRTASCTRASCCSPPARSSRRRRRRARRCRRRRRPVYAPPRAERARCGRPTSATSGPPCRCARRTRWCSAGVVRSSGAVTSSASGGAP